IKDGEDGKSPKAEVKDNGDGTHTITITNPDGTKTETVVRNGEKGEKGDKGENGTDGKDGLTPQVTVKDNGDGTHTVTVRTPQRDPQTGEVTYSETTTTIKDGEDGKSPKAEVKDNGDGTHTITITNPDGTKTETVVRNGEKGEKGDKGENGTDGKDGKDGLTPIITIKDATNDKGEQGVNITIIPRYYDHEGNIKEGEAITRFIRDGKDGKDGKDGQNGRDGKSITAYTEPGTFQGQSGVWIVIQDAATGKEVDRDFVANGQDGKDGQNGKDGKDGQSADVKVDPIKDPDGKEWGYKITITHPDGRQEERLIKHGQDGKDGRDGKDGKDGKDGRSIIATTERGDHKGRAGAWVIIRDRDTLQEIDREFIADGQDGRTPEISSRETNQGLEVTIKKPDGSTHTHLIRDGRDGKSGKDGRSITATTEPGNFNGQAGIWVIIRDRITGQELDRDFVANGQDGRDGQDGKDGKTPTIQTHPVTDREGHEVGVTITITQPDGSVTSKTIYHGRDGQNGKDGKDGQDGRTPSVTTQPGKDSQGNTGRWLIIKDGQGNEVSREFIRDGKDGQTPTVKVEPGKNSTGDSGQWIITSDGDGKEVSREFVRDGRDGQTPSIDTIPGKNELGQSGLWIIVKDPQGKESSRHFVRDGRDGQDGKDGKDGAGIKKIYTQDGKLTIIYTDNRKLILEIPCCCPCPETPTPETPTPETPTPEEPTPETPTPETPTPEEPTPETPTPEEPTPETPTPETPTPETPTPEEPTPETPTPETPTPEEPTPETPTPEEPTPVSPTPQTPAKPGQPLAPGSAVPAQEATPEALAASLLPETGEAQEQLLQLAAAIVIALGGTVALAPRKREDH
ncbi:collagen-flanked surface repeat-containing protein, partial [Hutsoniella sourekii]